MHPYLLPIPLPFLDEPFHLRSFGLLVAAGFLVGTWVLGRLAARFGDDPRGDPERYSRLTVWVLVGVFGGARLAYVAVEILRQSEAGREYLSHPFEMIAFWKGGLVMYGGLVGGVLLGLIGARRLGLRPAHALDLGLVAGFVGQSIGRIGCLMVGDDYGRLAQGAWERAPFPIVIRVPNPLPEGSLFNPEYAGRAVFATQVWMSLNALLLAWIGYRLLLRRRYAGQVSLWLILLYAISRFAIEAARGDEVRGLWFCGRLSTSQLVSLLLIPICVLMLVRARSRRDPPREHRRENAEATPA